MHRTCSSPVASQSCHRYLCGPRTLVLATIGLVIGGFAERARGDLPGAGPTTQAPFTGGAHWALVPPTRPRVPDVATPDWVRTPVDAFVLAQLQEQGMDPSPEADRVTLLRRLSLDLTGLPPSILETAEFLDDDRDDAYERLVERLLSSPHYGERWGRHWLDVARYADSNGYSVDNARSIWPYRDWVIDAVRNDMPFDQFTIEQLAGDLLPNATLSQRIATGFHRNTQINQEGGIDPEQFRIESIVDRVSTTGTVWLGLTIGCAQCHDHKFDPLEQREFYELFAFFNNADEPEIEAAPDQTTLAIQERDEPRPTHLLVNGDFTRPAERVQPDVPDALHPLRAATPQPNRLDLARWLMAPENPLTARVTVNRIWQHYFGIGLVKTENDFGTQGELPSHPALLDWLATEFVRSGWSVKAIHRLIVHSAAYRQSSHARSDLASIDPYNRLLARQSRFRLDAEIVRDVCLVASGLLDPKVGGPSVHPPQPEGVMNLGQVSREWNVDAGSDRYRRGIYTFHWRATPYPALAVFDAPDAFSSCTRRNRSNTPLQALTLLNDPAYIELAQGLARRILHEAPSDDLQRMRHACRICLSRLPDAAEEERLLAVLEEERSDLDGPGLETSVGSPADTSEPWDAKTLASWTTVARVLLNLDETITRE